MTTRTRGARVASIALATSLIVASPLLLSGCSLLHLPGSSSTTGGITIPGVGSFGTGKLPADFPKSVPVISGDVVFGAAAGNVKSSDGRIWNATIKVSGADAYGTIKSQLTGAGFKVDAELDSGDATGGTGTFLKDPDSVLVVVTKAGDATNNWVANYTVTEGGTSTAG
ncbi:MAG: hypothetical protein M3N46_08025 [Actinomycetota bacterium]|nr:hypothetical protein [Actinomycetota bacterium]